MAHKNQAGLDSQRANADQMQAYLERQRLTAIYGEGQRARQRGEPWSVVPYAGDTVEGVRWLQGWAMVPGRPGIPGHITAEIARKGSR